MPFIDTPHLNIYVEEKGNGPVVLYISGTGGDLRHKPGVLEGPLPDAMHVIAYDQRGLGQTEKPLGPYSMADYADDAANLLDALGHAQVDVIGVSFGGMVAQHFAIRYPTRVRQLVLCCTSPGGPAPSYPFHDLPDDLDPIERLMRMMPVSDTRRDLEWQRANAATVEKIKAYTRDNLIPDHATPEFKRGARLQLEARRDHDTNSDLPGLTIPTLICAGRYDGIAPPENQVLLHSLIPSAALNWYEGGHLFMIQDKQAWRDIIAFLTTDGAD